MKTLVCWTLLMLTSLLSAQAGNPAKSKPAPAQTATEDRMPSFRNATTQESLKRFREWFADAYRHECKAYRKRNKATLSREEPLLQDVVVQFVIDTLGRPHILKIQPEKLSDMQSEILRETFASAPAWNPGIQNGKKVRVKYTMPVHWIGW
ncbi:MAG: energy transducer TonB [Alistipes sp.]|nr:energy transducer TonB [Alistipes sp.]